MVLIYNISAFSPLVRCICCDNMLFTQYDMSSIFECFSVCFVCEKSLLHRLCIKLQCEHFVCLLCHFTIFCFCFCENHGLMRNIAKVSEQSLSVGDSVVLPSRTVRNIGAMLDRTMTMEVHIINATIKSCYA